MHINTADTSKLHSSRRTFGLILAASKPKVDCAAPITMSIEPRRPLSASARRIEQENAAREEHERRRAKSADRFRRRRLAMDDVTLQEEAFQDIEREYDMIVRSPTPWLPGPRNSHHRAQKGLFVALFNFQHTENL